MTNGIGGYASGTLTGANTRRYHGLLVAALKPPVERTVLFAKLDEEVEIDGRTYYLGTNEYPDGRINPGGFVHVEEFSVRDNSATTICLSGNTLRKTVWMERGHNITYIRYRYDNGEGECCVVLHPFCNYRDYHSHTKGSLDWNFGVEPVSAAAK